MDEISDSMHAVLYKISQLSEVHEKVDNVRRVKRTDMTMMVNL